jgi:uncharacterized protein with PQ loop repeat
VSAVVVLGVVGTCLTTIFMVPHLVAAMRARRPTGTALAWGITALQSSVWTLYGILAQDALVAAPGIVTIPIGVTLTVWALLDTRSRRLLAPLE